MIHLVVALIHEAKPLIARYRMNSVAEKHPFLVYVSDSLTLIISGIGKTAAAASVGYLQALNRGNGPAAWLNIGIAGHQQLQVGQGFIAHRIQDRATGRCYYPSQGLAFSGPSSNLITVDQAERHYKENSGYDMEASGFYNAAIRSSTVEFIQSYKIVSDHPQQPVGKMTKAIVTKLISQGMDEIASLISTLQSEIAHYRKIHTPNHHFDKIVHSWHFTETQKVQLKQLLRRAQVLFGENLPSQIDPASHTSAKTFLKTLSEKLAVHQQVF